MNLYKDNQNKVHSIEPENAHLLPKDCVEITQAEADILLAPTPEQLAIESELKAKSVLNDIDLKSIRAIREYVSKLPDAPKQIKDLEADAAKERVKLK